MYSFSTSKKKSVKTRADMFLMRTYEFHVSPQIGPGHDEPIDKKTVAKEVMSLTNCA